MRTFYLTIFFVTLMALAIPLHSKLAVSPTSPAYTHFIYMFGHASFLHWLVNSWCIVMVHRQMKPHRLLSAWMASVLLSFAYYPTLPVLGSSVIISFFMGVQAPWLYKCKRLAFWQMLTLLAIGFMLPNIAGLYHAILFAFGYIYAKAESLVNKANKLKP